MSYYDVGYYKPRTFAGGNLNWDLGLERVTNGTGTIGTESTTTAISIGNGTITTTVTGNLVVTQGLASSGSPTMLTLTGAAHTGLAAGTEAFDVNINLARTVQFATGALTTQRAMIVQGPTYGFVGASTITTASTVNITAAPAAGTNATLTNSYALQVGGAVNIGASAASQTYAAIDVPAHTVTITGSTNNTGVGYSAMRLGAVTITDSSAVTVSTSATLYVAGPPVAAGSVTLSAAYSLWVDSGDIRWDGLMICANGTAGAPSIIGQIDADSGVFFGAGGAGAISFSTNGSETLRVDGSGNLSMRNNGVIQTGGAGSAGAPSLSFRQTSDAGLFAAAGGTACNMSAGGVLILTANGGVAGVAGTTLTQAVNTSGTPNLLVLTGAAHTTLATTVEAIDVNVNLARTVQWAQGAITTQRAVVVQAPTWAFATSSSTVTNAITVQITAAPAAGTNAVFTNTYALQVGGAASIGATAAGMTYAAVDIPAHTITVTGSTQVTSVGFAAQRIGIVTITDSSAVTIDTAASLYIAGAVAQAGSVTITSAYSLWIDAGRSRFDDSVLIGATATGTNSPTNVLVIASGTVPTSSPADSITLYSTDNSAGNTIPSFYCEGTEVIATGQADSASSVRVKMRVNGTVATFLCI